jgi:hypothetical protein
MSPRIRRFSFLLALLAFPLTARGLTAQATWPPLPETTTAIVEARSQETLRREREEAAMTEQVASDSAALLRTEVSRAKARIQIHRSELETIKRRLDLAKKEKREAERVELDGARKQKEAEIRLLDRMQALREAQFRVAEGRRDAARSWRRAVEAEQTLEARSAARPDRTAVSDSALVFAADPEVRRSARRMLELRRDAFADRRNLGDRERLLSERALEALDAQTAVLAVKR